MSETDNIKTDSPAQAKVIDIGHTAHNYNTVLLAKFLELVFHDLCEDENILTWATTSFVPGYPVSEDALLKKLSRTPIARALYYGTATCAQDPKENGLRNRKALFDRLHVVVLDDIGTKVPIDKLPEELKPTYIIESSEGNFQYGYVLESPLDVLEQAEALIQLVYESGLTDGGGKMVTKLVRLPDGRNGKRGAKGLFPVKLIHMSGPLWTPKRLLEVMDLGVTWQEVLDDADKVLRERAKHAVGLTPWSPITPQAATLDGLVDPVLEWLYDKDMVKQETNEWVTIECAWSEQHTTGQSTAGYSPVGRGSEAFLPFRGFKCFHEHCSSKTAHDFLQHVAANGGPEASVRDEAGKLLVKYAFHATDNGAMDITSHAQPVFIPMASFQNLHPAKATVALANGKTKSVAETTLWRNAPNRVSIWGTVYDPRTPAKIVSNGRGVLYANMFTQPEWGVGDYDSEQADRFKAFIRYLIPEKKSAKYFLDWLACKVQDMAFRGAGIVMVAKSQGTGRTTLADMLTHLFGVENVTRVAFEDFISSKFNDFMEFPLIVSDETLDTGEQNFYRAYEKVKTLVDFRPQEMWINPKYGKKIKRTVYSSTLLFSNHEHAIAAATGDRRLYVIANADVPGTPEFFTELNVWLEKDNGAWALHVWRWLMAREVDLELMTSPAPMTDAKITMLDSSKSAAHIAVEAALDAWPSPVISAHLVHRILRPLHHKLGISDNAEKTIRAIMRDLTDGVGQPVKIYDKTTRLRLIRSKITSDISAQFKREKISSGDLAKIRDLFETIPDAQLRDAVEARLHLHDF